MCVAAADEHLHVGGLGRLDGFAERGIVGRHVAPAEQHQLLVLDLVGDDALDDFAPRRLLRHEQRADRVVAGLRQLEADLGGLAREEGVRNLHQDAGAVAGARIGADRAAMFEIAENVERVGDDLVRLLALDIGDEADAAGILFQRRDRRDPRPADASCARARARPVSRPRPPTAHPSRCFRARTPTRSSQVLSIRRRASPSSSAHLGRLRHPPGHRSSSASRNFINSGLGVQRPRRTALPATSWRLSTQLSLQSLCRVRHRQLRQRCCPNSDHAKFFSITQARESRRSHGTSARQRAAAVAPDLRQTRRDPAQGPPDSATKLPPGQRAKTLRASGHYRSDGR